ncbi:zf-HC2 domain-containing protein [Spongiactinospora sp. TRM90649]|uniref:anti-sigma factor family protein n=1 Tax=Spongiactinospora sp. TRM90649 TaxID=3031114 RepID=UPI0023FA360D|nr:zf-HC2 domain-containing protein [Spongiactinospora sp. TRM90649]MDF5752124.1 zf-HC2 domain-containing protein [Spongiactinospora sp. TRM90649]
MKRLSCAEVVERVTAYLDDDLGDETRHAFDDHTAGCEGCARYLIQFRATVGALHDFSASSPRQDLSPGTRRRLLAAFRESRRR